MNKENEIPLVSVCCFTYNHKDFIHSAMAGFLAQVVDFTMEIIIHDDASTDGTQDILREYSERYPGKFKLILQEVNQYSMDVSPFFKHVLPITRGKYIAMCDGDDYWTSPNKLQRQVDLMKSDENIVICHHNTEVLYASGERKLKHDKSFKGDLSFKESLEVNHFATVTVLFRADIIRAVDPPNSMVRYVDRALWLILLSNGHSKYIDETLSVYRQHSAGIYSGANSVDKISNRMDSFRFALLSVPECKRNALLKQLAFLSIERLIYIFVNIELWTNTRQSFKVMNEYCSLANISNLIVVKYAVSRAIILAIRKAKFIYFRFLGRLPINLGSGLIDHNQ